MSGSCVWVISTSTRGDGVVTVPVDQPYGGTLDHVGRRLVGLDVVAVAGRPEHEVVAQLVRGGEALVVVHADRFAGQVGGDVEQADRRAG